MTDDDYMMMLRESQLKRTIVVEDVDKIISENKKLKELLKELRISVMFDKDLVAKIDEVLNE